MQLLSAVTHRLRLTLAQVPIEDKSNEIPAFPKLVRDLPKADYALITADAMHSRENVYFGSAAVVVDEKSPHNFLYSPSAPAAQRPVLSAHCQHYCLPGIRRQPAQDLIGIGHATLGLGQEFGFWSYSTPRTGFEPHGLCDRHCRGVAYVISSAAFSEYILPLD